MCYRDSLEPFGIPLDWVYTRDGREAMVYSLMLGKVTSINSYGEHVSNRGFTYPIQKPVYDSNAVVGDHNRALHFAASPESATNLLDSYGSHRLAVLPSPQLWEPPDRKLTDRCWHSSGGTALFCMDCENIDLDVLDKPEFWGDMGMAADRRDDDFVIRLPRTQVWNRTKVLS